MTEPIMKRAKGDGVEIQLATREGNGRSIICVHGITANCRCWDVMASALSPAQQPNWLLTKEKYGDKYKYYVSPNG